LPLRNGYPINMETLVELQNKHQFDTDKNSRHFYLEVYDELFKPYKYSSGNLLEIGVSHGGSVQLWHEYFPNINIVGIDIYTPTDPQLLEMCSLRFKGHFAVDAYTSKMITTLVHKYTRFNIIIDDGPHTMESQIFSVLHYSTLIEFGTLIIEDVNRSHIEKIMEAAYQLPRAYSLTTIDKNSSRRTSIHSDDCLVILEFV